MRHSIYTLALLLLLLVFSNSVGAVYLNIDNISVQQGPGTSPGSFNNTFSGGTLDKVIDAPSANAPEFHNQTTHIWFTASQVGGGLELRFDFHQEYDISTLHFWNYTSESYDVDNVDFTFFNSSNQQVGQLSISPALGSAPGIMAEDIVLAAPLNVQYVTAFLSGTNRQVDFQNIGFTAEVSEPRVVQVPFPIWTVVILALVLISLAILKTRKQQI